MQALISHAYMVINILFRSNRSSEFFVRSFGCALFKFRGMEMKKITKIVSMLLSATMMFSILTIAPFTVSAAGVLQTVGASSGTTGNCRWSLDDNGILTISGTGTMKDYSIGSASPWGTYVKSVVIQSGVRNIGDYAFDRCKNLTSITIPNSVTSIGYYAFDFCENLTSITIPHSVTNINKGAFYYTNFASINVESNNNNYCSVNGVLFNKNKTELLKYPSGNAETRYEIPSGVTYIRHWAFHRSKNLTNITIPNSVKNIDNCAFAACKSLTSITIPDKVTSISIGTFRECSSLTSITIPNSIKSIGDYAFYYCTAISNITIPNSVVSIGESAFQTCMSLINITIPNSVVSIGESAFAGCNSLINITIPSSVKSIGDYAFYCCSDLTIYSVKNSAAEKYAKENNINFASASNLKGIEIEPLNDIEAKRMLSFLFNAESKNVNTEYSEFYEFLTGQYNSQPYKSNYVGYSLLLSSYISTGTNANNYNNLQRKSSDATLYWLQRMVGNEDISSAVANGLLGEAKNTIKRSLVHCVASDYDLNCIDSCMSTVTTIINSKDKVNEYVNKLFSAVSGVCFFVNYSKSGMYNYFEQYLNLRPSFDSADQYFNMLMWGYYSEYRYLPSYWKYSQDELNNWAELLYSIEQELISNSYYEPETTSPIIEPTKQPTTPLVTESTERPTIPSVTEPTKKPTIPSVTEPTEKPTIPSVTEPTEKPTVPPVTETTKKSTTTPTVEYIYTDNDTGISVTIENEAELIIKNLTDSESVENANIALGDSDKLIYLYDISLVKNGVPIQSNSTATVKIPTSYKNAKIYEIKDDGTKTNMNALYKDGYLIFSSNQLSSYALAISKSNFLIGDINQDGNVDIKDATLIQKYLANIVDFNDEQLAVADTNGDGSVSIADATQIQRYLAQLIPSLG